VSALAGVGAPRAFRRAWQGRTTSGPLGERPSLRRCRKAVAEVVPGNLRARDGAGCLGAPLAPGRLSDAHAADDGLAREPAVG